MRNDLATNHFLVVPVKVFHLIGDTYIPAKSGKEENSIEKLTNASGIGAEAVAGGPLLRAIGPAATICAQPIPAKTQVRSIVTTKIKKG